MSILDKVVEAGESEFYDGYSPMDILAEQVCTYNDMGNLVAELLSRMGSSDADEIIAEAVTKVLVMYIDETC